MMKTKALLLALTLAITPAVAQDKKPEFTRAQFKQACITQAPEGVDDRTKKAVCECATQFISAMKNGNDKYLDFRITNDDPLVSQAVPVCLDIAGQIGPRFFEVFEQTEVGASASE